MQLGKAAGQFLSGKRTMKMDFRQKSPQKRKTAPAPSKATRMVGGGRGGRAGEQPQIDTYASKMPKSNPISRQRSRQLIAQEEMDFDTSPWGDTDEEYVPENEDDIEPEEQGDADDPIELTDTDEPVAKRRKSGTGAAAAGKAGKGRQAGPDRSENDSPVTSCFKALVDVKNSVGPCMGSGEYPADGAVQGKAQDGASDP